MNISLQYSMAALHEAARFIWETNTNISKWPSRPTSAFDIIAGMQEMMRGYALKNANVILEEKRLNVKLDGWCDYAGTGGYYFIFELIDSTDEDIIVGATILVDPSVSTPEAGYVTEVVDVVEEEV